MHSFYDLPSFGLKESFPFAFGYFCTGVWSKAVGADCETIPYVNLMILLMESLKNAN